LTLLISEEDVKKLLTFDEAIEAVEDAYRQYGMGLVGINSLRNGNHIPPRCEVRIEGKNLPHLSPQIRNISQSSAYLEGTGMAFLYWSFHLGDRRGYISYLIDAKNGEILAIIKANATVRAHLGWMRVGADGAVGARYLSRKDSKTAGVIGTGRVGSAQLQFLTRVRHIEKAFTYSGRRKDEVYAREMSNRLGIDVLACSGAEEVVRNADILITATHATTPIVKGEWINEGVHISAFGADCPLKAELDTSTLKKADKIVIDYELALDTKEIRALIEQGILRDKNIYGNIGEVVAGIKPGRENPSEITIYKNTGMTFPYVAINAIIYKKAKKMGLGTDIGETLTNLIYS